MQPSLTRSPAPRAMLLGIALVVLGITAATITAAPATPAATATPTTGTATPPGAPAGRTAGAPANTAANGTDEARPPPAQQRDAPRRSPDIFVPTEGVPEDRPIAFPVDI